MIVTALKHARDCAARAEASDVRLEAIERQLRVNFERIAQLQADVDRITKKLTS